MLYTQTLDKLRALRLEGMAQALEEQRRQTDIAELDFEERLGLLVERQWLWKENRGFLARLKKAQLKISNATVEDINYRHPRGLKRAHIEQLRASAGCKKTATASSPGRRALAKATWRAPWDTKPVATDCVRFTSMRPSCFVPCRRLMRTGALGQPAQDVGPRGPAYY